MKAPLVICADDYAISPGTSAVIRGLLQDGLINATTCLVENAIWPAEAQALKVLAAERPGLAIGIHLNLTENFGQTPDAVQRPLGWWLRRAFLRPARADIAATLAAYRRQWQAFVAAFGRPPDFVDGHQHVHLYGPARVALFQLLKEVGFRGWVRQCRTSGRRFLAQRILMDPMSAVLCSDARAGGFAVNPGFGGLRGFRREEDLAKIWAADMSGFRAGGVLIVHPGEGGSPPGTESIDLCRLDETAALRNGVAVAAMEALGLALAADARYPGWG